MNNRLVFILAGQEINPLNRATFDLNFSVGDYSTDGEYIFLPQVRLSQNSLQLVGPDKEIVQQWYDQGNIFEGIPLEVYDNYTGLAVFGIDEACLDISAADFSLECDQVTAHIIDKRVVFTEQAECLNLRLLLERGVITKSDFVKVYYVIAEVPDFQKAAILAVTLFQMVKEVAENTRDLIIIATNALHFPGTSQAISVAQGIAQAAYIILMVVQIGLLIDALVEALVVVPYYYYGMKVLTLLQKACAHLGLSFSSSLFQDIRWKKITLIPIKDYEGTLVGNNSNDIGCPNMTFAELLQSVCKLFNAKAKIEGSSLLVERWDYFLQPCPVTLPSVRDNKNRDFPTTTNAAELKANIVFRFAKDPADSNTYQVREGYVAQSHVYLTNVQNSRFTTLKGLKQVDIPFAKAKRKDTEGRIEKIINKIYDAVRAIFKGGKTTINRIGCMELSQHAIGVPKLAIVENNGLLASNNHEVLNAKKQLTEYYSISSAINNQQVKITDPIPTPLTADELLQIIQNPVCNDAEGRTVIVEECEYQNQTELYNLKIRFFEKFTTNLSEVITDG